MNKVYISGPMTGCQELNKRAFDRAARTTSELGLIPINPHDLCNPDWDWHRCMRADIAALCTCDAIMMLPGWEKSNGAQLELHIAHRLGIDVIVSYADLLRYAGAL